MSAAATLKDAVERFLYDEARLIDDGRYADWLDLFDDDAVYWVPARPGQTDPLNEVSIMYDDKPVMEMRVKRLMHPRVYAQEPSPRATHLVSNVSVSQGEEGLCEVESAFVMTEVRGGQTRVFSGRCRHLLRANGESFRIRSKRVDLSDCDGVHSLMTIPF